MKKYFVLILIALLPISILAQNQLTLEEAVQIALQRNSTLIKTKNNLLTNEAEKKNAFGELLPDLGASGSWRYTRTDDNGGTQVDFFGNLANTPATTSHSRNYSVSVGGGWTLFDGLSNYANVARAEDNLEAAKFSLDKLKQDIVYQTTEYFYSVLYNKAVLEVRKENVAYNQKFFETVQERNRLGSAPVADVYAQQYQLGNAELLFIEAQNNLETAKNNLLNYLSLDILEEYEFVSPFDEMDAINTDNYMSEFDEIRVMVDAALKNRLDYKSQMLNVSSAENSVTIARSGYFPRLSGNYSYGTSATTIDNLFDRRQAGVGLTLSIPIFSNWSTEYQLQSAKVRLKNTVEDLAALERQIKIEVKQGYLNLEAAKKALDVSIKNIKAAEETRKVNYERYNLGAGTILDVLQADRDYQDALRGKINAEFSFYQNYDGLNNALGKLDYKKYE
ncbi:MAG: TolC family protein [Melioribacteraceae bacterium]|nr:TolC family protein [Melioribacteraceae bacterium]MCF8355488.1 TolC family protein [Melioribacteraceae bacterium]MCF8394913.1 TolC family protein [Melioribacteraceae bacterium]MCF8420445.1 TolC family protein [Melioribacteraceae bacterium]